MSEFRTKLESQIKALGVSPQGERFLMKALYPPGDQTQISIPDTTWHPTLRYDSRPSVSFGAHSTLPADASWDCMILAVPGDVTAAVVVTAPAGTDFSSVSFPANSRTFYLSNVPVGFAAQTKTYACGSRATLGTMTETTRTAAASPMQVARFRSTYRGITLHNTSSALYNGGTLLAAQYAQAGSEGQLNDFVRNSASVLSEFSFHDVPLTDDAITQMCPGAVAVEAKEGVFIPLRLLGPTQNFVGEEPVIGRFAVSNVAGPAITVLNSNNAASIVSARSVPRTYCAYSSNGGLVPFWVNALATLPDRVDDTAFDNVATGIVMLRNLPYQASFSLQAYVGLEAVVDTTSAYRALMMATATYDPKAIQAYYDIACSMPFTYPASYNSLGMLLPYISEAIKYVAPRILPFVGSLLRGADSSTKPARQRTEVVRDPDRWQTTEKSAPRPVLRLKAPRQRPKARVKIAKSRSRSRSRR